MLRLSCASLLLLLVLCVCVWCVASSVDRNGPVTPHRALDWDARRWLTKLTGPWGHVSPGMLNYFNFSRPEGQRFFYLYVPSRYTNATSWPLAFFFHGYTGTWMQGAHDLNMTVDAERAGYLLIFGQGTPGPAGLAWEAGICCVYNASTVVDDIAYTRQALKIAQSKVNVDAKRVYTMGWSNGGYMSERLACQAPELFAGVAAVASAVGIRPGGRDGLASCDRSLGDRRLNYLHFHGTADTSVSWTGSTYNRTSVVPSALENIARWVTRLQCSSTVHQTYNDGTFSNLVWPECRDGREVEFMTVRNEVHTWWTMQNGGFQTTTYIFNFFTRTHRLQQRLGRREKVQEHRSARGFFHSLFSVFF